MSKLVLDLSVWDEIDLAEWVEQRDLWGVVLKVGGNEGGRYKDKKFESHYADAQALGLRVGAYYYTTATDPSTAREDALHCLSLLDGKDMTLPVYIDVEDPAQLALDMDSMTAMVEAFCQTIEGAGHEAGIYSGASGFMLMDDSVCRYNLWLAYWANSRPTWATPERGYTMWQQGGMRIDGHVVYGDAPEHHDFDWWYGKTDDDEPSSDIRDQIVEFVRDQLGVDYYSMNYSYPTGYVDKEGATHYVGRGWGCACLASSPYNVLLGTRYAGSCYNFAGDALGQSVNQGGDEWEFTDDPKPGDLVLYIGANHDGTDYFDYGHVAVYVDDGMVIGAMGKGKPSDWNYLNIGISETTIDVQDIGGGHRFIRCKRLDAVPDPEPSEDTWEETKMTCMIHPSGESKIYYWDGSPESVPYHVSPAQKSAIERTFELTHDGRKLKTIDIDQADFNAIMSMTKSRKLWREEAMTDRMMTVIKAIEDAQTNVINALKEE